MTQVSERYAEALFGAAEDLGCVDIVSGELQGLTQLIERFSWFFTNPRITMREKTAVVVETLSGSVSPLSLEFVVMVLKRGHWKYLPDSIEQFKRLSDDYHRRVSVFLHVPFKPEQEILERLERRFVQKLK